MWWRAVKLASLHVRFELSTCLLSCAMRSTRRSGMANGFLAFCLLQVLLMLTLSPAEVVSQSVPVTFYPFGTDQRDVVAPTNDDGFTSAIRITGVGFPFFGNNQQTVFVNTNGDLSFRSGFGTFTPQQFPLFGVPMIAPYWADVNTNLNTGRIYYRQSNDAGLLTRASMDIRATFSTSGFDSFTATWIFIATWHNVTYYGGSTTTPVNTFQCVLITNGVNSFAMFNYAKLTWTTGTASGGSPLTGLGGTPAQVGFNVGDATTFYAVPTSRTSAIVNIYQQSNVGISGRWIFRVDQSQITSAGCQYTPACPLDARTGLCSGSGLCSYHGDPHYTSCDGRRFDYQGICRHVLVGQLPSQGCSGLPSFQVYGRNEYRNSVTQVAWFRDVEIVYGNESIQLTKSGSLTVSKTSIVKVNGVVVKLPYCQPKYTIYFSGKFVRYQTMFGLAVETDGMYTVNIYVPPSYRNCLSGLCGNFDGVSTNDLTYNNVDYSARPWDFGKNFVVPDAALDKPAVCPAMNSTPTCPQPQLYESRCRQLISTTGPFGACVRALDTAVPGTSTSLYNNCVLDACFFNESVICQNVFNLVDECAFRGFQVDCNVWQTATQCPVMCPAGMVFECNSNRVCMPTCDNPIVSAGCTRPQKGACVCPMGQLLYNGTCTSSCPLGCVDSDNNIHPLGDVWNRTGCSQLTCDECPTCPYGHKIVRESACAENQVCNSDGRCVALTTTPTTTPTTTTTVTTTTTATTTTTTTTPSTTTPNQQPDAYFIYNANGGVLTYGPDSNSLNGLALMTTDNILKATPFVFMTPCLAAQVPNANLSSGQCVTLKAADGSSLIAVNVMGGVSMMSMTNMQTQFSCEFNVDASVFLRRTQPTQTVLALQSVGYTAFYFSTSGVSQPVFMYYNSNNNINNNNYQLLPSITSYYFMLTYTGFSTVSTTCPNVWTLTSMARPATLGSFQGNFTAAYCRQLCLVYPNCVGVTIQNHACMDETYPCYFTIAGAAGQSLVIDPNYIHYDLNPTYPSRCSAAGDCMVTWTPQTITVNVAIVQISFTTLQLSAGNCRDQCRMNSSCLGIRWSAGVCVHYFRGQVGLTMVQVGVTLTYFTPSVNSLCDKSSPVINVLMSTSDVAAIAQPSVNGYEACYTLCMNNVKCNGFQLQAGGACYLSMGTQLTSTVASSYSYFEVRRSPSGNGCQNQWTLYSNVVTLNSVPYVGPMLVRSEQDCRAACMSAALNNRSCFGIDYNQSTNSCKFNNAALTSAALNSSPATSNGWNHFELTLSSNCFNDF